MTSMSTLSSLAVFSEGIGSILATTDLRGFSKEQQHDLANTYFNSNTSSILPLNRDKCLSILINNILANHFVCVIKDCGELVGFLIARKGINEVSRATLLQQTFYFTSLVGIKSAKAVWAAHRVMLKYAKDARIDFCISGCSHLDSAHAFNKILAKDDWYSEGHLSSYEVKDF
jgi:hypothetical protein